MAVQTVFVLGIALAVAVLNVYFRDIQHFVGIGLQVWFYATPIVYPIKYVRDELAKYRAGHGRLQRQPHDPVRDRLPRPALRPAPPGRLHLGLDRRLVAAVLVAGWAVFRRREARLAEEL